LETINKRTNSLAIKAQELVGMIIKYAIQRGLRTPYTQGTPRGTHSNLLLFN